MGKSAKPELLCRAPQIEVRLLPPPLGRAIFAARAFARGELIERAPCLFVPQKRPRPPAALADYYFRWPGGYVIALGYVSLYNHSENPNVNATVDADRCLIELVAMRAIRKGEELRFDYAGDTDHKVWFTVCD